MYKYNILNLFSNTLLQYFINTFLSTCILSLDMKNNLKTQVDYLYLKSIYFQMLVCNIV